MKKENKNIKSQKESQSKYLKKLQDDKNNLSRTESYEITGKQYKKEIMENYSHNAKLQLDSKDNGNIKKEKIVKKNISSKNIRKTKTLLNKKIQRNSFGENNEEETKENKKKIKSDGDKMYKNEPKFFLENI